MSWLLNFNCLSDVTVCVLWLFLTEAWVGLQCVIAVFPDHTHWLVAVKANEHIL